MRVCELPDHDHLPLEMGGMRLTQERTYVVMQVFGGSPTTNGLSM